MCKSENELKEGCDVLPLVVEFEQEEPSERTVLGEFVNPRTIWF